MTVGGSTKASVEEIEEGSKAALAEEIANIAPAANSVGDVLDTIRANNDLTALSGGGTDWSTKTPQLSEFSGTHASTDNASLVSVTGSGYITDVFAGLHTIDNNFELALDVDGTRVFGPTGEPSSGVPNWYYRNADSNSRTANSNIAYYLRDTTTYRFDSSFDLLVRNNYDYAGDAAFGRVAYVLD